MTSLSGDMTARGYALREFPRGPLVGWVRTAERGSRQWRGICSICGAPFRSDRRTGAAAGLARHYGVEHKATGR